MKLAHCSSPGCEDIAKLARSQGRIVANRAELSKISEELEHFLTVDELDIEFQAAEEYNDRTLNTLAQMRRRVDFLERAAKYAPRAPAVNQAVPFRQKSAATTLRPRLLQLWTGF